MTRPALLHLETVLRYAPVGRQWQVRISAADVDGTPIWVHREHAQQMIARVRAGGGTVIRCGSGEV